VNTEIAELLFPLGADTAGVRRGAKRVRSNFGKAVKVWIGEVPGQCMIGAVPFVALSITVFLTDWQLPQMK